MTVFDHALSPDFIAALRTESERAGWWRDVLADPKLVIATRGRSLNVYWQGQSIFAVSFGGGALQVTTHEKFLMNPGLTDQVPLRTDGTFNVATLRDKGFVDKYDGAETLRKLKAAAGVFANMEKKGCHQIAVRNANVIDVEIAFPGRYEFDGKPIAAPRVDLAALDVDGSDARLVFWEAKTYANGELRAIADSKPPVCGQVHRYRTILAEHRTVVEDSYGRVAANLVAFKDMGWARTLSPLITAVGRGEARLHLGDEPQVGLVVFGFDAGQRDEPRWVAHRERLRADINPVKLVGDPKQVGL